MIARRTARRSADATSSSGALARAMASGDPKATAELCRRARAGDATVEPALERALESPRAESREAACDVSAQLVSLGDVGPLLVALRDECSPVRVAAAAAIARHAPSAPSVAVALYVAMGDGDPAVHAQALAALGIVAPSEPVVRALGLLLVSDRYGVAQRARAALEGAPAATSDAALPLLAASQPFERRGALELLHATARPTDALATRLAALCEPGTDTYVRRAAARAMGRVAAPTGAQLTVLARMARDWDPGLRVMAAVVLGQLATRRESAHERYAAAIERIADDELPELAAALRSVGAPTPPHGPLLARLARATGFSRLDLADAVLRPFRARRVARDVFLGGVELLPGSERIDDALELLGERERPTVLASLLALAQRGEPAVRGAAAVLAAHAELSVGVAMALTRLAESDPDAGVRAVARALLDQARAA